MALFNEIVSDLKSLHCTNQLYRFQGGNSYDSFDISNNRFNSDRMGRYFYFSNSFDHHKYFAVKRLRQFVNNKVLLDSPYSLCYSHLQNVNSYNHIRNLVINSDKISGLYGVKLIYASIYYDLIKENCCHSNRKISRDVVERVDIRTYGGGYGVTEDWLFLLESLTFFSCYQGITRSEILELISNMRNNRDVSSKDSANFIRYNNAYKINPKVYDDYAKYDIMNYLQRIISSRKCLPTSKLYTNPTSTIKEVISEYQKTREKVLQLLDGKYKNYFRQ